MLRAITEDQSIMMTAAGLFLVGYKAVDAAGDIGASMIEDYQKGPLGLGIRSWLVSFIAPGVGGLMEGIGKTLTDNYDQMPKGLAERLKTYHAILSSKPITATGFGLTLAGIATYIQLNPQLVEAVMSKRESNEEEIRELIPLITGSKSG